jgi:hypothetical protein
MRPAPTGLTLLGMTIGMVAVAFITATVFGLPPATMTSTPRWTNSSASAESRPRQRNDTHDKIFADTVAEAPQTIFKCSDRLTLLLPRRNH